MIRNDDIGLGAVIRDHYLGDLRRRQCLRHEISEIIAEGNNVDLFAAELIDNHSHPGTTGAHACSNRINVVIIRPHRNFCSVSGLASTCSELNDAVSNFGNFKFKQTLNQTWVCTRDNDLRPLGGLANLNDVCLRTIAAVRSLIWDLFSLRHKCLDSSEVEKGIASLGPLDNARHQVALTIRVFLELAVTFHLTNAL